MLISNRRGICNTDGFEKMYVDAFFTVYMKGILFCRGKKAGKESIEDICRKAKDTGSIPFSEMYGGFTILIDYQDGQQVVFTDNSCMQGFFVSENYVGSNFAEIIDAEGVTDFDEIGVCEYLCLTRCGLSGRTYVKGIGFSDNLHYYWIHHGKREYLEKGIPDIDGKSGISDPVAFFYDICHAFSDRKVVCALTGGFDSRAVASVMNSFNSYDCFISGDNDLSPEIICAKAAANAGGYLLKQIRPSYPKITDELIYQKFITDGSYQVSFDTGSFRVSYFMQKLSEDGYEIIADGSAGDMHKEFWITQDFPFYKRKRSNPERFYRTRMKYYTNSYGQAVTKLLPIVEQAEIEQLKTYSRSENIESCLMYGWYNDWFASSAKNAVGTIPKVYSPLQEIELVRYSYGMKLHGKIMNFFLRQLTTAANPAVARVKTVYGTTESAEPLYIARDLLAQSVRYAKQVARYLMRRYFYRSIFLPDVNQISLDGELRQLPSVENAVSWAEQKELIKKGEKTEDLSIVILEKILNLYFTEKYILKAHQESQKGG